MEQNENNALVAVRAIDAMPADLIVNYGDAVIDTPEEQLAAVRAYIRAKVLKQYGVVGINNQTVSQLPIGFNGQNVQTALRLPKVKTDAAGVLNENIKTYYARVLPDIAKWFKNALFNSTLTVEQVATMD